MKRPPIVTLLALFHALNMAFMMLVFVSVTQPEALPIAKIIGPRVLEGGVKMVVPKAHRKYDQGLRVPKPDVLGQGLLLLEVGRSALLSFGLWSLLKWARWLTVLNSGIWLFQWMIGAAIYASFDLHTDPNLTNPLSSAYVTWALIHGIVFWCFLQPDMKEAFGEK